MLTDSYLGLTVVPGGRDRRAVDCWGLVVLIYDEQLGVKLPRHDEVNWKDNPEKMEPTITADKKEWLEVAATARRAYDVVVLRVKTVPWHVGIVVDRNRFIHADAVRGVCIERLDSIHWKHRVLSYHRMKEADNVAIAPSAG